MMCLTLLSSQYRARHWSPGLQARSTMWPLSGPLGPLPCPGRLLLLLWLFEALKFFFGGGSLLEGHGAFGGLIGPVLLCSISPFWKWAGSPAAMRQSCDKPASWAPPTLKLKFGGLPSRWRSKWSEFGRSGFPILLLLLCSSILSDCL